MTADPLVANSCAELYSIQAFKRARAFADGLVGLPARDLGNDLSEYVFDDVTPRSITDADASREALTG